MSETVRWLVSLPEAVQWLLAALPLAGVATVLVLLLRRWPVSLLPPRRQRAVPWNGYSIVAVAILYELVPPFAAGLLADSGLLTWCYGPEFLTALRDRVGGEATLVAKARFGAWAMALALPFTVAAIVGFLHLKNDARPYQMGLTRHRLGRNLLLGFLAWLVVMPFVLAFNGLVDYVYKVWLNGPSQPHMLEILARSNPWAIDWFAIFFTAVVAAPVAEELLFRGVILPWAAERAEHGDFLMFWSGMIAFFFRIEDIRAAVEGRDWSALALELQPVGFVALMTVGYLALRARTQTPGAGAIYATALLFGCIHANVWPTPIALFILAVALGWLALRTQSLTAPIFLHALFNATACFGLMFGQNEPAKGNDDTAAARRPSVVSTLTPVPGSQLPRRR